LRPSARRRPALAVALAAVVAGAASGCDLPDALRPGWEPVEWRRSAPSGSHSAGALVAGVRLPAEGRHFATWEPGRNRSPSRPWRRWGADRTVRAVLAVAAAHRRANQGAPRLLVGDLSRPRGGPFGPRFGGPGHGSHHNGLDVDVYYPRRDRLEAPPVRVAQIDRRLAQDLVDRFLAAGADVVFVGPRTGLTGPRERVVALPRHDNHLHARF
jgi:murein endopeptidase